MTAPLTTPSPYLRDGLLALVAQLRAHAEEAAAAQRDADAEVERLRAELADAQDHARARAREVAELTQQIRWVQEQAEALRPPSAAQQHAATGLMPQDPGESDPRYRRATCAELGCTSCLGCDDCACHDPARSCQPDEDELPFNVVQAPDQVVAALTGGTPTISPDDPPGEIVATHGPGETGPLDPAVTTPDTGLAHPVPNPPPAAPAAPPGDGGGRHARPKGSRRTGGWPLIGRRKDEQDGDTDG